MKKKNKIESKILLQILEEITYLKKSKSKQKNRKSWGKKMNFILIYWKKRMDFDVVGKNLKILIDLPFNDFIKNVAAIRCLVELEWNAVIVFRGWPVLFDVNSLQLNELISLKNHNLITNQFLAKW